MGNGQDVRAAFRAAQAMEWLIVDGLGGSASGTASGAATRRTHSLLTTVTERGHMKTLLVGLDERVMDAQGTWDLGATGEPDAVSAAPHAAGYASLEAFTRDPAPTWRMRAGNVVLERRIQMIAGHHAIVVRYRHMSGPDARLTVGPCVVCRSPLDLEREDAEMRGAAQGVPGRVRIELRAGDPALTLWHNAAFLPARVWRRGIRYALDDVASRAGASASPADGALAERGAHPAARPRRGRRNVPRDSEDALVPGWIDGALAAGKPLVMVISTEEDLFRRLALEDRLGTPPPRSLAECVALIEREGIERERTVARRVVAGADFTARQAASAHDSPMARRREPLVGPADRWALPLGRALDRALTRRGERLTIAGALPIPCAEAGHPLRALPALVTLRRFDEAREVLAGEIEYLDEGLALGSAAPATEAPPGAAAARESDPEPALWLVAAADVYVRRSDDLEFLNGALYPALESVMQFYRAGTRGVRVGATGLLEIERDGHAIARADLNALWYHALVAMAQLARLVARRESGAFYLAWARELQQRFSEQLWDDQGRRLFDRIEDGVPVSALSPSQVLAASLHPLILTPPRARALVGAIERELFTPYGLREAPSGARAIPAWLGPYYSAYVRTHARDAGALSRVHDWLDLLRDALGGEHPAGVPAWIEVAGGVAVRSAGAYSTAAAGELLRAWIEELDPSAAPAARIEPVPVLVSPA